MFVQCGRRPHPHRSTRPWQVFVAARFGAGGSWPDWRCCCSATPRSFSKLSTAPRRGGYRLRSPVVSSATAASPLSQPPRRSPTTPAAPHPPRRGKRRVPRFGTWRWCRRPPKPSTRTPCGKIPPKSAAVCPCLTRSRAPSPGCCWRLQQRIRLTAPSVLAGVGGRVRRLPLSSRRLSSVAGRPTAAPKAPEPRASPCVLG